MMRTGLCALITLAGLTAWAQDEGAQAFPFEGDVVAENLNIRMSPKVDAADPVATVLHMGDKVTVTGEAGDKNDFYQILPPKGCFAWIFGKNVKRDGMAGAVVGNDVPVRRDSRANAPVLCTLGEGDAVKVVDEHMGWLKIETPVQVKYYAGKKYVRAGKAVDPATIPGVAKPKAPPASSESLQAKLKDAERLLDEQKKLIDERQLDRVDLSGVVAAYEQALGMADDDASKAEVQNLHKRYKDVNDAWMALKEEKAKIDDRIAKLKEDANPNKPAPPKGYDAAGYVATTGSTLLNRPGTHKLMMGGRIVAFLRVKDGDDEMIGRLNDFYEEYVGVKGTLVKDPEGWSGYTLVIVDDVFRMDKP